MDGECGAAVFRGIDRLYRSGTVLGETDGALLRRFVESRDEAAFEALLDRHGPMLARVCRQAIRDPHEAEDAFQATLVVLVRKAGSLYVKDSLGPWLYGVAYKVVSRTRAVAERRGRRQRPLTEPVDTTETEDLDERVRVLHEELGRLPAAYRDAVLVFHLEGLSHDESAARLGCPVGTLRSRLARGRALLRQRLSRRGFDGLFLLAGGWPRTPPGRLSASLVNRTIKAAASVAAGRNAAGALSASAAWMAEGVLTTMLATKLKAAAAAVLTAGIFAAGGTFAYQDAPEKPGTARVNRESARPASTPDRVEAALDAPVTLDLRMQSLTEVIAWLEKLTGLEIAVDQKVLAAAHVDARAPVVSFQAKDIPVKNALAQILEQFSLAYAVKGEMILIKHINESKTAYVRVYYVGDLFGVSAQDMVEARSGRTSTRRNVDLSPLVDLITSTVSPGTWTAKDVSGRLLAGSEGSDSPTSGTITPFYLSLSLIIRHSAESHDQVAALLSRLRKVVRQDDVGEQRRPERAGAVTDPSPEARRERIRRLMDELNREIETLSREGEPEAKPPGK